MTYQEIVDKLHALKCDSTVSALDNAVHAEAVALVEGMSRYNFEHARARVPERAAYEAAREFYASDITRQLADPEQPTPARVLNLRRFPVTWAVAETINIRTSGNEAAAFWAEDDSVKGST